MDKNLSWKRQSGFDEAFKARMKNYFRHFAEVVTDFEILKLPRRVDILIIEKIQPIRKYVKIFTYFKRFNIIEFKSEKDRFVLEPDLYDLGIYINGVLRLKKEAKPENTTFSLVSSTRPAKLIRKYKADRLKKGLYIINNISLLPLHLVVIEELDIEFEKEVSVLKDFTSRKDRRQYLEKKIEERYISNEINNDEWNYLIRLYFKEINKILKERSISLNIMEKNIRIAAEEFGLKKEYIQEGIETERQILARKALSKGYPIEEIMDLTGMSREDVMALHNSFSN
ncbi:MAG: hypothetical protein QG635_956 [Bacteroidota bacterium]|nr:hypothetical protein [Bacteroidota bacterium]